MQKTNAMDIKVGDKVKFLNEEGGGIVAKILDNNMVSVTIEDGFDIPTLRSNLIKLESQGVASDMFTEDFKVPQQDEDVRQRAEQQSVAVPMQPQRGMKTGLFLIFQTEAGKPLLAGNLDVYLLNNSEYSVYYSLHAEKATQTKMMKHGMLSANHREYLDTINRDQLDEWSSGFYQVIFVHEQKQALAPANDSFRLRPKRFYKEDNYNEYPGWNTAVFAFELARPDLLPKAVDALGDSWHAGKPAQAGQQQVASRRSIIDKHMLADGEAKVDLHIEQLVDDHHRMNSMEILNTQIGYFRRVLESALMNNVQRLIIIHGVGAGILKAEIRRELQEYDYIEVHDAPIAEYGVGASIARIFS